MAATWRLIARQGIHSTTMREIAREAGFGNGSLVPYFANKEAIITAAFAFVFEVTNERIAVASEGRTGLAALEAMLGAVFPLEEDQVHVARIVMSFFEAAAVDGELGDLHTRSMAAWRTLIETFLAEAVAEGTARADVDPEAFVDQLITMATGIQILALLNPREVTAPRQRHIIAEMINNIRVTR